MKILHTADWHIGAKLGGHELTPVLLAQIERICNLCLERDVDILLVAGDVFEKKFGLAESTKELAKLLQLLVAKGIHIVLVPGNHDDRSHFRMMRELMSLAHGEAGNMIERRVKIVEGNEIFAMAGVHICAMPYPNRDMLMQSQADIRGEQRVVWSSAAYADVVRAWTRRLKLKASEAREPMVFVAHVTVAGVTTPSGHEINYNEDIRIGRDDLPSDMAYIALGHIHQQQKIATTSECYYSGSIERLDMGEWQDEKCVLLVDIPLTGPTRVEEIPLSVNACLKLKLGASEIETLLERVPEASHAFSHVEIDCEGQDQISIRRRINEICPRALDVKVVGDQQRSTASLSIAQPRDISASALEYVRERFADDPELVLLEADTRKLLLSLDQSNAVISLDEEVTNASATS